MNQFKQTLFENCRFLMIFGLMMTFGLQSVQAENNLDDDTQKYLRIVNDGNCAVNIYWWIASGDVFYTTIQPGNHWDVNTYQGHKWRAVDTQNNWSNLQYDESYMVTSHLNQTWTISPNYCGNCTGEITKLQLNKQNGSSLVDLSNGMMFCESDFPNDIRIRALVNGSHESLKFTITGPGGTWTNTENQLTYDSKQFWANPGEYTVKAELYRNPDLGGSKCDEETIHFTVNDCSNPCNNVTDGGSISGDESQCLSYNPGVISSSSTPSGGSGAIEYLWLSSTDGCPNRLDQAIQGANGATYNPGTINQTTYYVRCSRRAGCTDWTKGESNCVTKEVLTPPTAMSEGQDATCGSNNGKITFFFNDNSGRTNIEFSIDGGNSYPYNFADNSDSGMASNLSAGTYNVFVRWGNDECATDLGSVTIGTTGGDADGDGVCDNDDCRPNNPNISSPGDACNDGDPNTSNDVIQGDCSCEGTTVDPCAGLGGDSDGDGVCDDNDCRPNNANISSPGDACNDGDSNTENDVIQGDCSCEGTLVDPNTCNVDITVDGSKITINNITGAITAVKVLTQSYATVFACDDWTTPCNSMEMVTVPGAGTYFVQVQTYADWSTPICNIFETVVITGGNPCDNNGGDTDGDGVCTNQDCDDNNPNIGGVGSSCNDGNPNTINDILDGNCNCEGTPITGPCSNNGGDLDGDGVCADVDCDDNSAGIGGPGSSCDDGNPNTINDVRNANCNCEGTPVSNNCDVTVELLNNNDIKISGIAAPISQVQIIDATWNVLFECSDWTTPCNSMESLNNLPDGTYFVQVKTYLDWSTPICDLFETVVIGGTPPDPVCSITASVSNIVCSSNGTATTSDDTYSFDVTADVVNDGGWGFTVVGTNVFQAPNGSSATVIGVPISNGVQTFTVRDADIANCTTTVTVTPPAPCSAGDPCVGQGGDSDGDGVCAANDCDDNNPNVSAPGDACDDGNPNTNGDVIQNDCSCAGTPVSTTCDVDISTSGNTITVSGLTAPITSVKIITQNWATVASCDDWSTQCSATELFSGLAAGTYYVQVKTYLDWSTPVCDLFETVNVGGGDPCAANGGDADGDGICADFDCNDFDANVGGEGSSCNDGNPNTTNDMYDANCNCVGTIGGPCAANGGDADGDGVCADIDCNDNDASIGTIGSSCDDGDPNTNNDVVDANCNCAGTPGSGTCDVQVEVTGSKITVSNIDGAITAVKFLNSSWTVLQSCDDWTSACGTMEMFTAPSAGTYYVQVQTYADWSTPICDLFETVTIDDVTPTCDNVTDGGSISGDETGCEGYDPATITSTSLPSGGSGTMEYLWLSSTTGCPTQLSQAIDGATGATYNPGPITQTTYYRRCSRRAGCTGTDSWYNGESNCVVKTVESCGPSVCADRDATNADECNNGTSYGVYTEGGNYYTISNAKFVESTDGTAEFTGHANGLGSINVSFTGRTSQGTPKFSNCLGQVNTNDWYYYSSFSGTIGNLHISRRGEEFHVGTGGNNQNGGELGASGWWEATDGTVGDINIRLSGSASDCAGSTTRSQILGLDVEINEGNVDVTWSNNTGSVNEDFEIQRSIDGTNFETIETRPSKDTDKMKFYSTKDQQPLVGANFYRVKLNYSNGNYDFSETRRVNISDIEDFGLFPNPAQQTVNVSLRGYEGKDIEIQLIDQFGKRMKVVSLDDVSDSAYSIELNNVNNGVYSLWIFTDGKKPVGKKMIVNKMY